ncbi:uncharacterized protein B0J16DRAFT_35213 [Fusarium flagelliforme]|uniref:uncharacterized protein n=1 Tax=Fusarium flagelliforme TaxID=2675880 RepID=UPI001E8CEBF5|nr:uncharacterized protein B0J16DRAFT_35213 [Fusarium flagelliforme]KAH7198146.1 hypothetical protein B0J16DRAFT_35213 [Fusarium flagelliforme]
MHGPSIRLLLLVSKCPLALTVPLRRRNNRSFVRQCYGIRIDQVGKQPRLTCITRFHKSFKCANIRYQQLTKLVHQAYTVDAR